MTTETYNGYSNRETWAFNLHWQNDEGLYSMVLDFARSILADDGDAVSDAQLGKDVIAYAMELHQDIGDNDTLKMMREEVGSWWRVNEWEVGEAVRESLGVES